ncbi:MAG: sulfotransferase [Candidatus Hydrogenedentes bacterium]|nr:sulfotransferase [Candidatus Hydrogenedentota bacterium]
MREAGHGEKPVTLLYITGYNYSGSTLLAFLINAHPLMASTGEICGPANFTEQSQCSCGAALHACPAYREIEERVSHPLFELDRFKFGHRLLSIPPTLRQRLLFGSLRNTPAETLRDWAREHLPWARAVAWEKRAVYAGFVKAVAGLFGAGIVADSSKNPMNIPFLTGADGIRLSVIHLVRHPAACVFSAINRSPHGVAAAAAYWARNFKTVERVLARAPRADWMRLRYEDVCVEPEAACRALCEWIGVPFDPAMLRFRQADHHIYGNPMRLTDVAEIRLDTRWHAGLSEEQLRLVESITGSLAQRCGYRFDPTRPVCP